MCTSERRLTHLTDRTIERPLCARADVKLLGYDAGKLQADIEQENMEAKDKTSAAWLCTRTPHVLHAALVAGATVYY
jgi:hypothetical protein